MIRIPFSLLLALSLSVPTRVGAGSVESTTIVYPEPLHSGRIHPQLFGNFIELLDDVVPGLWAEMFNDRSFEGVKPVVEAVYYDGKPGLCDRTWDPNRTWDYEANNAFNGNRCAKLIAARNQAASLTQSGLASKRGKNYTFSGWFRADQPSLKAEILLKALLPSGGWTVLASARLAKFESRWTKQSLQMKSAGESDQVVFELRVEGAGNLYVDKLSLMPVDNVSGWRSDIVSAIEELRPSLIRWGGSVCDPGEYRWKDGIGDRDARRPFVNKNWGRMDPNDVGIDEFCQLCERTHVEPLICLSFSDGARNAADLVEYCNGDARTQWGAKRAANGHAAPYHIQYWQIGNEISGDDPKYLEQFGEFVSLMKRVDSQIRLLSSFPSKRFLERHGREIDFVGPHHYTRDFPACENDFKEIADLVSSTPGCSHIKVAVTEWNESGGEWGLQRGRQMTLHNALHNATYLNLLLRHSDQVEIACRSSMANSFCGGVIQTSLSGLLKRPGYYALQLFARHVRTIPLRLKSTTEALDCVACASEDKKTVTLFAVNLNSHSIHWTFQFDRFDGSMDSVKAESLCDTLNAHQLDAMNHWESPDRIRIVPIPVSAGRVTLPALSVTAMDCVWK